MRNFEVQDRTEMPYKKNALKWLDNEMIAIRYRRRATLSSFNKHQNILYPN